MSEPTASLEETPETVELSEELNNNAEQLHGVPVTDSRGQLVLHPSAGSYHDLIELLVEEGYDVCIDLCGVPESEPMVATISGIHPGAEAMEREASDMFGLCFEGHPDPTPILLPDGWEGHPLRKDFAIGSIPVQFKAVEGR